MTIIKALRRLFDSCEINIRSLKSLGVDTAANGTFLCPALLKCLPDEIRLEYSRKRNKDANWNVDALLEFLKDEVESRETSALLGAGVSNSFKANNANSYNLTENQPRKPFKYQNSASALTTIVNKTNPHYREN